MTVRRALLAATLLAAPLAGQYRGPRGGDYLFVADATDARALWVNPGGLGVIYEASVMAELLADDSRTGSLALTQATAGFNSRGIAFGYRRDLYNDTLTGHTWRFGAGRAVDNIAVGASLTLHSNGDGPTQRGLDLGIRYRLLPSLELGAIVRDVGKPIVHDSLLDVGGTAGLGFVPIPSLRLDIEGSITNVAGGGTARRFRGGLGFTPGSLVFPMVLRVALDLNQDFDPTRLTVALQVGGRDRVTGVVSGARPGGELELNALSLTGVASRRP